MWNNFLHKFVPKKITMTVPKPNEDEWYLVDNISGDFMQTRGFICKSHAAINMFERGYYTQENIDSVYKALCNINKVEMQNKIPHKSVVLSGRFLIEHSGNFREMG